MRNGSAVPGLNRTNRILYGLIFLAMFMSLGHHIDHVIRGNHVGWPPTHRVTPFTYSLGVYPLIFLGPYLYASGRVGPGFWRSFRGRAPSSWLRSTSVLPPSNPQRTSLTCTSRGSSVG
ncbi:MAG: hypothetical protein K0Q96_1503 [Rubrobacteraceae bacterium]|jgi:hypothetical protein|nr:hypothetical protein [Rubrobacteraceae bacterium]